MQFLIVSSCTQFIGIFVILLRVEGLSLGSQNIAWAKATFQSVVFSYYNRLKWLFQTNNIIWIILIIVTHLPN